MANVGIITFFRDNYGAFLQAYALEKILSSLGNNVEIIDYDYTYENAFLGVPLAMFLLDKKLFVKKIAVEILRYKPHKAKKSVYDKSVKQYLVLSCHKYRKYKELCKNPTTYDVLIAGSDQVFNPILHINSFKTRLLGFDHLSKVKASYAASLGDYNFPLENEDQLLKSLKQFDYISIREQKSADLLKDKLKRDVLSHCDPTLLLSKEEWLSFSKETFLERNYTLIYVLKFDEKINKTVADLINQGEKVISIGNRCRIDGVENRLNVPVDQFVGYIRCANRVITNSFHGTVFSILFHKKNVDVFLPPNGGGRITNIIENCALFSFLKFGETTSEEQYEQADFYIKNERKKAIEYLKQITETILEKDTLNEEKN